MPTTKKQKKRGNEVAVLTTVFFNFPPVEDSDIAFVALDIAEGPAKNVKSMSPTGIILDREKNRGFISDLFWKPLGKGTAKATSPSGVVGYLTFVREVWTGDVEVPKWIFEGKGVETPIPQLNEETRQKVVAAIEAGDQELAQSLVQPFLSDDVSKSHYLMRDK